MYSGFASEWNAIGYQKEHVMLLWGCATYGSCGCIHVESRVSTSSQILLSHFGSSIRSSCGSSASRLSRAWNWGRPE